MNAFRFVDDRELKVLNSSKVNGYIKKKGLSYFQQLLMNAEHSTELIKNLLIKSISFEENRFVLYFSYQETDFQVIKTDLHVLMQRADKTFVAFSGLFQSLKEQQEFQSVLDHIIFSDILKHA